VVSAQAVAEKGPAHKLASHVLNQTPLILVWSHTLGLALWLILDFGVGLPALSRLFAAGFMFGGSLFSVTLAAVLDHQDGMPVGSDLIWLWPLASIPAGFVLTAFGVSAWLFLPAFVSLVVGGFVALGYTARG
jgi:hypothetical protein